MGKENFIKGHGDNGHHDGRRSAVRRVQSAMDQMRTWRDERIVANETGHRLPAPLEEGGLIGIQEQYPEGRGTEFELFTGECVDTRVFDVYNPSISVTEDPRLNPAD